MPDGPGPSRTEYELRHDELVANLDRLSKLVGDLAKAQAHDHDRITSLDTKASAAAWLGGAGVTILASILGVLVLKL